MTRRRTYYGHKWCADCQAAKGYCPSCDLARVIQRRGTKREYMRAYMREKRKKDK